MSYWKYFYPGDHDWGKMMEAKPERHGSPIFYELIQQMAQIHNKKSHDYASDDNPFANYQFAGKLSKLFDNPDDAGFIGRIGEKLYRLANLENHNKLPSNESIADTEVDICVIVALWVAMRRERRSPKLIYFDCALCGKSSIREKESYFYKGDQEICNVCWLQKLRPNP
jgi:hypothetical protein